MKRYLALLIVLASCSVCPASWEVTGGSTDQYVYFVAVDGTDFHTRETDLVSGDFTVYYSINGGNSTAMTTPTITELSKANQPGEYKLLIDEAGMTTLGSGIDQTNLILSISHASIDRVSLSVVVKATISGYVDGIEAKTNNLPASPAAVGSEMVLTAAYDAAKTAAPASTALSTAVWTGTKAGYLDAAVTSRSSHDAAAVVTAMGTGTFLTAIPWNASWNAEVQSEATDALNTYDPPTNAEMEARTLAAADYLSMTATIDGVTFESLLEAQLADLIGKVTVTSSGANRTFTYYKQDGTTVKMTITATVPNGNRTTTGTLDPG